ncbi:hypothetical protein Q7P35_007450 [Cladosporium inversicolor]
MALALGKRKRRQDVTKEKDPASDDSDDNATARALFQRAFEKKFKPLEGSEKPAREKKPVVEDNSEDDDDDSDEDEDKDDDDLSGSGSENDDDSDDFSGFSETEAAPAKPQIEVIEDRTFRRADPAEEKRLKKQFMSAKIPSTPMYPIPQKSKTAATAAATDGKDENENDNIQNDLALQRLLKESHLLDANTFSASGNASCVPEGAARLKALDMRIRDLGGKKSHLEQDRMPIAFRKGMVAKASEREDKRRTEAKENGIILERFGAKTAGGAGAATRGGGKERKRAIGTGGPDIGTFRGATLRLSKNDIKGMEGSSSKRGGKGGRGGRGGKRKGPTKFGSGF